MSASIINIKSKWRRRGVLVLATPPLLLLNLAYGASQGFVASLCDFVGAWADAWRGRT